MMNIGLEIKLHLKHEGRTQTWPRGFPSSLSHRAVPRATVV